VSNNDSWIPEDPSEIIKAMAQAEKEAPKRLDDLMFMSLPDAVLQSAIEKAWDRFKSDYLQKIVEAALKERVEERVKVICSTWTDASIDAAIYGRLQKIADGIALDAGKTFWAAVGSNVLSMVVGHISQDTVIKTCSTCNRVYGPNFSGNCSCGSYVC
jgi:hypothetical protein